MNTDRDSSATKYPFANDPLSARSSEVVVVVRDRWLKAFDTNMKLLINSSSQRSLTTTTSDGHTDNVVESGGVQKMMIRMQIEHITRGLE